LIFTGQHPALDSSEFGLGGYRRAQLNCPGVADPNAHVREVVEALLPLMREAPDVIVVQGDTSSALGAALAGFTSGIPSRMSRPGCAPSTPSCRGRKKNIARRSMRVPICCSLRRRAPRRTSGASECPGKSM
jgi:hypothetical protein